MKHECPRHEYASDVYECPYCEVTEKAHYLPIVYCSYHTGCKLTKRNGGYYCQKCALEFSTADDALRKIAEPKNFDVPALSGAAEVFRCIAAEAIRKNYT